MQKPSEIVEFGDTAISEGPKRLDEIYL